MFLNIHNRFDIGYLVISDIGIAKKKIHTLHRKIRIAQHNAELKVVKSVRTIKERPSQSILVPDVSRKY